MFSGLYFLFFLAACFLLAQGGAWTVKSLIKIADFLGWKRFVVASLIMGFISSLPELFVGLVSAMSGKPELAFGNIIGANIIILTLIVGVSAFLGKKIQLKGKILQRSLLFAAFYVLLPMLLIIDGRASAGDGLILIIAFVFYLRELFSQKQKFSKPFSENGGASRQEFKRFFKAIGVFLAGVCLMVISAQIIVFSASRLALHFNLPLVLIGALGVALGTTLPELIFSIRSMKMKQSEMALGNMFGSIAVHTTLGLGLVCLISPFRIYNPALYINGFIFSGLAVLAFLIFSKTGEEITKKEAKILFFIYFLFFVVEAFLG